MPPLLSPTPGSDCHVVLFDVPKLSQILQALHNVIRCPALLSKFIQKLSPIRFAAIPSWWLGYPYHTVRLKVAGPLLVLNLASASRVFGEVEHRRNTAAAAASTSAAPTAPGAAAAPAAAGLANKAIWKPPPPLLLLLLLLLLAAATVTVVVVAVVTVAAVLLLARPRSRPRPTPSAARAAAAAAAAPPIIVTSPPVVVSGAMTVVAAAATAATAATAAATPIAVVTVTVTVTTVRSSTLHGVRPGVLRLYSCARRDPLKWSPFRRNHNHIGIPTAVPPTTQKDGDLGI